MRNILSIICILLSVCVCQAQSLSEILKDNSELTSLFVRPAGIKGTLEDSNTESLKTFLEKANADYKYLNLGKYGNVFRVSPSKLDIGGVNVSQTMLVLNDSFNGVIYESEPCENYKDMYTYLCNSLKKYSVSDKKEDCQADDMSVFMLSDKYGIGLSMMNDRKISMAFLMDMKNLMEFMNLNAGN